MEQGASTQVWALLTDELKGGEYLSHCAVKELKTPAALDPDLPGKLWAKTEELLAVIESQGKLEG